MPTHQHLEEGLNPRIERGGVLLAAVGLQSQQRDPRGLEGSLDVVGLHRIRRAELQHVVQDAVGMRRLRHLGNVLDALVVGGEDGAVDLQVAIGQGVQESVERVRGVVDEVTGAALADTGLLWRNCDLMVCTSLSTPSHHTAGTTGSR